MGVKRYGSSCEKRQWLSGEEYYVGYMAPANGGEWVRYSDYQAAQSRAEEAEEERDFLLARLIDHSSEWVGRSSNMMVGAAMGREFDGAALPWDNGDLQRCEETYRRAPDSLKPRLLPILRGFRLLLTDPPWKHRTSWKHVEAVGWLEDAIDRSKLGVSSEAGTTARENSPATKTAHQGEDRGA